MPENTVALDAAVRPADRAATQGASAEPRASRCPVAHHGDGSRTLTRHADVRAAALDDVTFSNATSRFLKVPNGLDGAEHTAFRALVDRYFTSDRLAALEPTLARIANEVVSELGALPARFDAVDVGASFAVRASCAWLGWPATLESELLDWIAANRAATRSGQLDRTAAVADWFDRLVHEQVLARRDTVGDPDDVTGELVADDSLGRRLTDEEITSILRNWTGGDLDSVALCTGVVLAYLADHDDLQHRLRGGVSEVEANAVIDEILRIDDPFVSNRRRATQSTVVGDMLIAEDQHVVLSWADANRDPDVFGDPDAFDPVGNAQHNLVYGIGRHVCPGRQLATMELRTLVRAVLTQGPVSADPDRARERSSPPSGGYARVPLMLG